MANFSTPGIYQKEIDNSIRSTSIPSIGIGAMVLKSNKGPVNQRILTSSYDNFTQMFGEPENLDDYGHFAAENYLAVSNNLLCVRATMGDEGYAQIQYPYNDADINDVYRSKDTSEFRYVNNEDNSQLKLVGPLSAVTNVSALSGDEWIDTPELKGFALKQRAQYATISDLITDTPASVAVYKTKGTDDLKKDCVETGEGKYVEFVNKVSNQGEVIKKYDDLILTTSAWSAGGISPDAFYISNSPITVMSGEGTAVSAIKGFKTTFTIPRTDTLTEDNTSVTIYYNEDFKNDIVSKQGTTATISYTAIFNENNFYAGLNTTSGYVTTADAVKIEFRDWDDLTTKTHYVLKNEYEESVGQAAGIQFREYGMNTKQEALVALGINDDGVECTPMDEVFSKDPDTVNRLADEYGVDVSEITTSKYSLLRYYDVWEGKIPTENDNGSLDYNNLLNEYVEKIIYTDEWLTFVANNEGQEYNEWLFWTIGEKNTSKPQTIATYVQENPNGVVIPWQADLQKEGENEKPINKMVALATSEVLNSTNETYRDGYTLSIESDDEPGNGDVEQYVSNKNNQLIIAAIGPGEYGNDIGVSIITTEAADVPALNHQNAFNWKYRYDDEDQIEADADDLTWKKVYRINVYVKTKTQTSEAAWGTGMDALLKEPVEFWYVSNDPTAKDNEGNSLYAPNVINGNSDYIYVSRNSVNEARTGAGTYAQPQQTYAIYPLTGGTNSKKNNIAEKTAALKLYKDRQKADFDILFNVDAIETFNGRQRYNALQRKIAEIASARKLDIGVVQVTSKEAKTVKRMIGEAKMFAFNEGSYVAPYCNYDKYYNYTLGSWIYLPKSVAAACAMAYCDMYSYSWMAPAGVARGGIQYATGQLTRLTDDEIGQLYDINVNTSRQCGAYGEVLWGQKTALKKESALNRINVRRCLNYIEKQLETMLIPYLFQQNTANTRSAAKNSIDAFLSRVQAAEGIIKYELSVTENEDDPHIMDVAIRIIPAEAIEYISIKITVDRNTGVTSVEG